MADFVAVLRKTLEGLGDPDPALRARVYDKARAAVAAKLAALDPPPAPGVAERQQRSLEDAIADVERGYASASAPPVADPLAELENVFASLKNPQPKKIVPRPPPVQRTQDEVPPATLQEPEPPVEQPVGEDLPDQSALPDPDELPDEDEPPQEPSPVRQAPPHDGVTASSVRAATVGGRMEEEIEQGGLDRPVTPRPRRRGLGRYLAAAVVLAMLAGGAFGIWLNKDAFGGLLRLGGSGTAETAAVAPQPEAEPVPTEAPVPPEPAAAPEAVEAPAPVAPATAEADKFTQRLTPEGSEVDPGPAGGESSVGEGTSVAALTQPPPESPATGEAGLPAMDEPAAAPAAPGEQAAAVAPEAGSEATTAPDAGTQAPEAAAPDAAVAAVAPAAPAAAAGQKAIFYEERTSVAEGSAEPGSIAWSLVQESPGANLPPEPAIRAEATIPGKDVQLRMTIKRNADKSLPASHIIEMIFLTPEGFEGGGIENILRVAMKSSEQEAGNPLIGIPAKIADGFFLVALNDTSAEIDANMLLLRRQGWIDVPLVYKSGRRALLTMEKGNAGAKVFDDALKAWQAATAG